MTIPSVLIPTSVIGSYAIPSWLWTGLDAIKEGKYGPTDQRELFDDAVQVAIRDQERAGVDVITDGEMRRWYFVQGFYGRMSRPRGGRRAAQGRRLRLRLAPRYRPVERVRAEHGLGIVEEFKLRARADDRPLKATVPGPADADDPHPAARRAASTGTASSWPGSSPR